MKNQLKFICRIFALIVGAAGILVLTGWLFNISLLKSILSHYVSIKPNTALCFLLSGVALWITNKNKIYPLQKTINFFCSLLILLTGLLTLSEYVFGISFGIDELLFTDNDLLIPGTSNPGRMSPNTAINFILTGLAFLYMPLKFRVTQVASFLSIAIAFFVLVGYLYSVSYLTNFSFYANKMALHTTVAFLLLGMGILFSHPGKGFMSVILSKKSGGGIARPLLLFALVVPLVLGWLLLQAQYNGLFQSFQFRVAMFVIIMIVALIVIIWVTARSLNSTDKAKEKTEEKLANLNTELETKVEERTKYLDDANKELAFQNRGKEESAADLIIANKEHVFQNEEREKRAAELVIANKELAFQNHEKEKRAAELLIANKELAFQNEEKEKRAAELIIANKELAFQNEEKEKRAAELTIANKELAFQNEEKEKRAAELTIANTELAFQNDEKEKRAAELTIANKELAFQNDEKEKRAAELTIANKELAFQNDEKEKRAAELIIANEELAFQNDEKEKRAAELIIANKELAFQNDEKEKRAAELIIANKELAFQNEEKEKRAAELIIANKELAFQYEEKEKRAAELTIANKELAFQNEEKEKRAAELTIANTELAFQNDEKEKRAAELTIANKELAFQNEEKEKRAAELIIANEELAFQNDEKEKRAAELIIANKELAFQNNEKEKRAAELTIAYKKLIFQNEEKGKTEKELIQSERRLAKAQQLAHMGSWEFDMVHDIHTWSDGMYNIYGIDDKQQPSIQLFLSFMHPDDLAFSTQNVKKTFATLRDFSFDFRFIRKDGEVQYGHIEYRFEFDQNKKPVRLYGIVQDMSEKKKAENEVVHIENRFRALIEKGTDMKTLLSGDGKLLYGSPSITKVLGYTLEEYAQKSLYDFIHPEDISSFIEKVTVMLQNPGNSFYLQQRMLHKNGNWIWCEGTSTNMLHEPGVEALVSNFRDISEKKIAEQQREFDSNNLNALINNTTDLMWSVDTDFKLITFNQPFYDITRHRSGKQLTRGSDVFEPILSPEQTDRLKISYARAFTGEAFTEIEYIPRPVEIWSEISYYPILNADGVIGTACHSRNITARKLAELERTKITNDLIQHNKDLEQFAYIVSHNLRAPVANILGASGRLNDPLLSREKKDMLGRGLNESVIRLDDVIKDLNNILQVKREINETREKVLFSTLVDDIKISIKNLIDADNIEIKYNFSEIDECLTLRSYFYSIFYNLISNSIKYRRPEVRGIIDIKSHQVKDKIELVFTDNGRGIDLSKKRDQVFGLYKRFHANTEGKGMGLFMVKTQVETLGGKISIRSEVDKGTEFKIEF